MALTADRSIARREGQFIAHPMKSGAVIFKGAAVALDANGWAIPAATATGLTIVGWAQVGAQNAGADGEQQVMTGRMMTRFENDAGDPVGRAHIGGAAYWVDDETVAASDGGTRSPGGIIRDVDAKGVWVEF